jgi:hypothetical protein
MRVVLAAIALALLADRGGAEPARVVPEAARRQAVTDLLAGRRLDEALAVKLQRLDGDLVILDGRAPELRNLTPMALGCGAPCTTGVIEADLPFFVASVDCDTGAFGLRTGASHPATIANMGVPQGLTFDGAIGDTVGGEITWFLFEDSLALTSPVGGRACTFDPPDTPDEPLSGGIEQEWTIDVRPDLTLNLRQEVVAFGSQPANAGIRLTLQATNDASSRADATLGVRWWIDTMLAEDDGPAVSSIQCSPFVELGTWLREHELTPAEVGEVLRAVSNVGPELEVAVLTSAAPGWPDAGVPSRLVVARWANAPTMTPWDYVATEGDGTDDDAVILAYRGHDMASAVTLAPGESFSRALVLVADCDGSAACQAPVFTALADPTPACAGDPVALSATISDAGTGTFGWQWDFGDGAPAMPVADPTQPTSHAYAAGTWTARLTATNALDMSCRSVDAVQVDVQPGVPPTGELDRALRARRPAPADVELSWPTSTVTPPGHVVFRTDDPREGAPTPMGIGDETVLAVTSATLLVDPGAVDPRMPPLLCYVVLPADSCGDAVFP